MFFMKNLDSGPYRKPIKPTSNCEPEKYMHYRIIYQYCDFVELVAPSQLAHSTDCWNRRSKIAKLLKRPNQALYSSILQSGSILQ